VLILLDFVIVILFYFVSDDSTVESCIQLRCYDMIMPICKSLICIGTGWSKKRRDDGTDDGTPEVRSVAQAACTPPVPAPAWHGTRGRRMHWTHRPRRRKYECCIL